MSKKVAVIIGSTRPGRIGESITKWAIDKLPQDEKVAYEVIDLKDVKLPFLDEALPPMMGQYKQTHTKKWAARIAALDGFIFVTPEYNAGYPAELKNAIDYLKAEWIGKPVTIVSYGYSGGASASNQLREVFERIGMKITKTLPQLTITQEMFGPDFQLKDVAADFADKADDIRTAGTELINAL